MKKVSIDVWIQLFGMLSVVAGLIFVGLQMMQTQRIALASQQQARAGILNDMVLGLTEADVDFQSIFWERNFQNSLSTEEVAYRNQIHIAWSLHENDFYQYTQGLMDEETWTAKLEGITLIYGYCDVREIYNRRAPIFAAPFRTIVESLPDECAN
ncbi:MAG: hypothetical protein ACJZ8R_11945 [Pseudohongiellaceae bacterium]|uniref:Uncharacterized protein n=1 Tax=OM182 bacterium MED-G28 TaxID=1986256 RepID=A0A2A5WG85_9GAMM|nr:MAG: hypothetical protein CNF02_00660 [OM182 bacterium MED-G28]|tara:strand:+ start:409 stop:873 length:465 start_codon:yes stop_codon:yes gene_type:complete